MPAHNVSLDSGLGARFKVIRLVSRLTRPIPASERVKKLEPFGLCGAGLMRLTQNSALPWNAAQTLSEASCGDGSSDPSQVTVRRALYDSLEVKVFPQPDGGEG